MQCVGDKKDGKVKVVNVPELAKFAAEERPKAENVATAPSAGAAAVADPQDEEEEHVEDEEDEEEEDVEEEE